MKLLAYDTSGEFLAGAVTDGGRVLAQETASTQAKHASVLVPFLEKLLRSAKCRPDSLDAIAVCAGPGSFTGIRVGIATAQMLGFAWKKKLIAVSSLEAVARAAGADGKIAVMLDARRGKVYAALYERRGASFRTLSAPALADAADFIKKSEPDLTLESAAGLNGPAIAQAAQGKRAVAPEKILPLYLHPKDCNVTLKKK